MKKDWEKPKCDICQTRKFISYLYRGVTTWEHPGKFSFVKCARCGLVFQSPRAPFEEAIDYYPSEHYYGFEIGKGKKIRDWKRVRSYGFDFLYTWILKMKKRGKILDIGAGSGIFLSKFKEEGWDVLGTDISREVAKYAKKVYGIKILVGDVVKIKLKKDSFDVITLNGVFEHIYTPRKTLLKIGEILKKDGLLSIVVPNIESLGHLIHKGEWYSIQPGRHLYHFSSKTITELLKDTGFEVIEIKHSYWAHNYYILFESARFRLSPRFKKTDKGGLAKGSVSELATPSEYSLFKEIGKIIVKILAIILAVIEPILRRGEVITVYAKKV